MQAQIERQGQDLDAARQGGKNVGGEVPGASGKGHVAPKPPKE